jgi:hypothetical protein
MVRSESLKKAQKKYYEKLRTERGPVFEKMRKNQLEYQKKYNKRQREDPEKLIVIRQKNKVLAKKYYYNNRDNILNRRKELRDIKNENELIDLLNNKLIEVSIDE